MEKTNAIRILQANKIEFNVHNYDSNETNGQNVAKLINADENQVFKTLVTISNSNEYFVFVIPVNCSLNLKKAANSVNVKSIQMIKQKELLPLTGYVHGGCSPIGMKKMFKTIINDTAMLFDKIYVSAGKVGMNMEINPFVLKDFINATFIDVVD